jgi:hypothetical protein
MRFLTPLLFAAAAGWVAWYNGQHADRAMVLPFVSALDPAAEGNPARQGELTVMVLGGLAVLLGAWDTVRWLQDRRARAEE